jgi:hypothetical protein
MAGARFLVPSLALVLVAVVSGSDSSASAGTTPHVTCQGSLAQYSGLVVDRSGNVLCGVEVGVPSMAPEVSGK